MRKTSKYFERSRTVCDRSPFEGVIFLPILVVSEKLSAAMSVAAVLGAKSRKHGYMEGNGWVVS